MYMHVDLEPVFVLEECSRPKPGVDATARC
jgi:hypothetical protein